ncbi:hypothetical protein SAMN05880573_11016 [Chryseobacterium sp. RU33C]|nr:hypothetical protein SAMN05880573_11016 [Chryseobacterium sp. RU33C]
MLLYHANFYYKYKILVIMNKIIKETKYKTFSNFILLIVIIYLIFKYFFFEMEFHSIEKLIGLVLFFLVILIEVLTKRNDSDKI